MPKLLPTELPEVARARRHWIVLLEPPSRSVGITGVILLLLAVFWPWPMIVPFVVMVGGFAFLRWQTWTDELVILTQRRLILTTGIPETTTTEASLRVDRIHGAVLEQTLPGRLLGYGTIHIESPGTHDNLQRLHRIERPGDFYARLRAMVFGDGAPDEPDEPGYPTLLRDTADLPTALAVQPARRRRAIPAGRHKATPATDWRTRTAVWAVAAGVKAVALARRIGRAIAGRSD